jgi:hypothetical protein
MRASSDGLNGKSVHNGIVKDRMGTNIYDLASRKYGTHSTNDMALRRYDTSLNEVRDANYSNSCWRARAAILYVRFLGFKMVHALLCLSCRF